MTETLKFRPYRHRLQCSIAILNYCNTKCFLGVDCQIPSSMPSDFLAVEFICLIWPFAESTSHHLSAADGSTSWIANNQTYYVERRKMSLDNVRRQAMHDAPPSGEV